MIALHNQQLLTPVDSCKQLLDIQTTPRYSHSNIAQAHRANVSSDAIHIHMLLHPSEQRPRRAAPKNARCWGRNLWRCLSEQVFLKVRKIQGEHLWSHHLVLSMACHPFIIQQKRRFAFWVVIFFSDGTAWHRIMLVLRHVLLLPCHWPKVWLSQFLMNWRPKE